MASTEDTPHIGSDHIGGRPNTGSEHVDGSGSWNKVRQPANRDYYAKPHASAELSSVQKATNNGLNLDNPSKTLKFDHVGKRIDVTAVYNQHTNHLGGTRGYDPTHRYDKEARASNYGMARGEAAAYNEPIHVVGNRVSVHGDLGPASRSHYNTQVYHSNTAPDGVVVNDEYR